MPRFTVKSIPADKMALMWTDEKEFAQQDNDDGSFMHVGMVVDMENTPWFKLVFGDGKGQVITEYVDVSKLFYDWAAWARIVTLVAPGGDAVSGV